MKNLLIFLFTIIMISSNSQEMGFFYIIDGNDDINVPLGELPIFDREYIVLKEVSEMDMIVTMVGLRYQNVTIPKGSEIISAYVQFTPAISSSLTVRMRIQGEKSANSEPYSNTVNEVFWRDATDSYLDWTTTNWLFLAPTEEAKTPDLKEIIQEIIDMDGWASGNAMSIQMFSEYYSDDSLRAISYESEYGEWYAPQLMVEFINWVDVPEFFQEIKLLISPNPFTASTTLSYELNQSEKVSLCIYDQMGKQVHQTQEHQQLGKQSLMWNAEGYADGVYYYRLQVGDAVANGKMVKER